MTTNAPLAMTKTKKESVLKPSGYFSVIKSRMSVGGTSVSPSDPDESPASCDDDIDVDTLAR